MKLKLKVFFFLILRLDRHVKAFKATTHFKDDLAKTLAVDILKENGGVRTYMCVYIYIYMSFGELPASKYGK